MAAIKILNRILASKGIRFQNNAGQNGLVHVQIADTNGTTPVNLFGPGGAPIKGTIVAVVVAALDTTAGNILPKTPSGTVVTVAKGVTAGVLTNGTTIVNGSFREGDAVTIESSSAGNARVSVYYTTDAP